jgi:hypothetical protein
MHAYNEKWRTAVIRRAIKIKEPASGAYVDGLLRSVSLSDKVMWSRWHGRMPPGAEDGHWDWDELIDLAVAMPDRFELYALEAADDLQGLGMLEVSQNEVDRYGVHLLRLSTAPWNRPPERRYTGVGSQLFGIAILRSIDLVHRGCMHCESLSGAEAFYERNGMIRLQGRSGEGLRRFRFDEDGACRFLARLRDEGLLL